MININIFKITNYLLDLLKKCFYNLSRMFIPPYKINKYNK